MTPEIGIDVLFSESHDEGASFSEPVAPTPRPVLADAHPSIAMSLRGSTRVIGYGPDRHGIDRIVHRSRRPPRDVHPPQPWE